MEITVSIDDDVLGEVRVYARSRQITFGEAVSELVRRGLNALLQARVLNGFHVVELPLDSPSVSVEHVAKLWKG